MEMAGNAFLLAHSHVMPCGLELLEQDMILLLIKRSGELS